MDTNRTRELFAPLIQRPILTDKLLERPPFKFLHDIVRETLQQTGYPDGLFTSDELDSTKTGSSRENKVAFLQKLIDILNVDGHLDNVNPAKIVAGKETELTNLLLQSLASEAATFVQQRKKALKEESSSKSKSSSSKRSNKSNEVEKSKEKTMGRKTKSTKNDDSAVKSIKEATGEKKGRNKEVSSSITNEKQKKASESSTKGKERKKRSDSASRNKQMDVERHAPAYIIPPTEQEESTAVVYSILPDSDSRRTPPDRESSGGTSKGGDDSGIAEETGAESERHDLSERDNLSTEQGLRAGSPNFIELHGSHSPVISHQPSMRPGTSVGRPQTAIGRPGTALARPAPPKPKKNIISTNISAEPDDHQESASNNQYHLILENGEQQNVEEENFLIEEEEEHQILGFETREGVNIAKLQEGEEHGALVNKIIENTRELETEQMQDDKMVEDEAFDVHERRRTFAETESAQKSLQKTTQFVQPLVRTLESMVEDFDGMLRELEDSRKQSAVLERQLNGLATEEDSQTAKLETALRTLDNDILHIRDQIATSKSAIIKNENKITEMLSSVNST